MTTQDSSGTDIFSISGDTNLNTFLPTQTTTGRTYYTNSDYNEYIWTEAGRSSFGTYEIMGLINSIIPNYGCAETIQYTILTNTEYYKAAKSVLYSLCWLEIYADKNGK